MEWRTLRAMSARFAVVSIHDIAPSTIDDVRWLLAQLDGLAASPRVLKVIPDEGGVADVSRDPALIDLLRRETDGGSEVVQHGCTHRAAGRIRGAWPDRLLARLFAARDAEFVTLSRPAARERLAAGRVMLERAGFRPDGFCAPGWLGAAALEDDLRAAGFRYSLRTESVRDLSTGRLTLAPAVGFGGGGPRIEALRAVANAAVTRWPAPPRVLRVFLHPQGARTSAANARVLRDLPRWLEGRRIVTYAELLGG
jgi:predicted deacetylase